MEIKTENPRNTGKLGKKRTEKFCKSQSKRLKGKLKSEATKLKMRKAATARWADPSYREKHSKIMKERWAQVHKAEKFLKRNKQK